MSGVDDVAEPDKPSSRGQRARAFMHLAFSVLLFSGVMLISRFADLGIIPGRGFGAGDWKRGKVILHVRVLPANGADPFPLGKNPRLEHGDRLEFFYGETRYLYLWIVRVRPSGELEFVLPETLEGNASFGHRVNPRGEVIAVHYPVDQEKEDSVLMGLFVSTRYRFSDLQRAAKAVDSHDPLRIARNMVLPSRRFVHVIRKK